MTKEGILEAEAKSWGEYYQDGTYDGADSAILSAMDIYATHKIIDENLSILAMAKEHMDARACVVLEFRISNLQKLLK